MAYLIFTDKKQAEAAQIKRDIELGYPESLNSLRWIGAGRHCPKEFGRALHYCELTKSDAEEKWAILDVKEVEAEKEATKVDTLPENWYPSIAMESFSTKEK